VRAVCSAGYTDTAGEKQTVELTHWLTDLTKQQLLQIMEQQQKGSEQDNIIKTAEEAAEYAGVDERSIEQWQADGMLKTNDGYYIKSWLDLYLNSGGKPSVEQKNLQRQIDAKLIESTQEQNQPTEQSEKSGQNEQGEQDGKSEQGGKSESDEKLIYGYTIEQLEQMSFDEVWEIALKNR
jgi:hypothetical protein